MKVTFYFGNNKLETKRMKSTSTQLSCNEGSDRNKHAVWKTIDRILKLLLWKKKRLRKIIISET